jgi:phosphohistidine phosphatase
MSQQQKIVYLVRHAKSSWADPSLSDKERPLNKRGRRSAPDMGQRMAAQGHKPDIIVASPAKRANSTARIIASQIGYDESDIITDADLYFKGSRAMQDVLAGLDDRYQSAMIVGHNPTMTDLMNTLGNTYIFNMPTCAIAVIGFDMASWSDLYTTDGALLGYDYPKGSGKFDA